MRVKFVDLADDAEMDAPTNVEVLRAACAEMGFDYAVCGIQFPDREGFFAFSTFPKSWTEQYKSSELYDNDPYLKTSMETTSPFDWSRLRSHPDRDAFHKVAEANGMPRNGASFPVHGPRGSFSILSVAKHCTDSEWNRHISSRYSELMVLSVQFHETLNRLILGPRESLNGLPLPRLSKREQEILQCIKEDGIGPALHQKLGLNVRGLEMHLKNVRMKLDALTTQHAVIRASALGLIA